VNDVPTYRAKARDLRARAEAATTAAEASNYLELARAWDQVAREAEALVPPEPRVLEN
jgi:hypothetical protein